MMKKGTKTMLGEAAREFDDGADVIIDPGVSRVWLDKEEFEMIKLPELNEDEQKYYDKIKQLNNSDKRAMTTDVIFGFVHGDYDFKKVDYYKILEAIIKGGYN